MATRNMATNSRPDANENWAQISRKYVETMFNAANHGIFDAMQE
jgi:hypothetical protein